MIKQYIDVDVEMKRKKIKELKIICEILSLPLTYNKDAYNGVPPKNSLSHSLDK